MELFDVVIIGAGPSGSVSASLLKKQGLNVCILEKQHFPRFVIGESLLPYCMEILKKAELVDAINNEPSFQLKNGAAFTWGNRYTYFDFTDKFTAGAGTTFQVRRDKFDQILIDETIKKGVDVRFGNQLINFNNESEFALLDVKKENGEQYQLQAKFVLDASGYGRVLPKLLDLELPSHLPTRTAKFTHIDDNINDPQFDRNKILITTHPIHRDVWFWLIPFADNRCSIGVVGLPDILKGDCETVLKQFVFECPMLKRILNNANWDNDVPYREICSYSANVKTLYGKQFALLGNAAEFLDPVFSSGVTIALHSAHLACNVITRQLKSEAVDWQKEFADPLMIGVNAFRTYVLGWYDYSFQDVIYAKSPQPEIRQMIASILAGYAWDSNNPLVNKSSQRLATLAELCGTATQDE
ncbi:NAD(P)/FAD-dependent oxidoreductase [Pasteurella skyensis]|uniref:NAD(P)/FAD-dependent oxidoreductase n=1 Tax=Phocoenobacter skyensis TaxID=97481 RepID=A0AAJ6NCC5_9PAST|nr:NAD(P)/FAD-dependent oxidoreductase [Pasteurella skyensis]MDP8169902.1 NAD(P)/FAD-dependent oxidoreductase [Pasteurella skyensis]MDP8174162.1 NAD(P)/FAD-dependent oxidoreductase [Pasteurella skyensis]